ncbi:MAG: hypothetical protein JO307_32380 [Bryobacterales bacterium]|nr:hypothetical protein [Bryobacterales bacterium]MBV9400185.1 hypothetical protein [Bryobacterales bacterium]
MKLAGFLLLVAGGFIALTSIVVLPSSSARSGFMVAGLAVELVGLILVFRAHMPSKEERG